MSSEIRSKEAVEKRKVKRNYVLTRIVPLYIILLFLLYVLLGVIMRQPAFLVEGYEFFGNESIPSGDIQEEIVTTLSGYMGVLIPRNSVLYPRRKLEAMLKDEFPRVKTLDIHLRKRILVVSMQERDPAYLWCGENPEMEISRGLGDRCFFMDIEGIIFDRAPFFSDRIFFKFYGVLPTQQPLGTHFISRAAVENIQAFRGLLKESDMEALKLVVRGDNYLLYIDTLLGKRVGAHSHVVFSEGDDIADLAERLSLTLEAEDFKNKLEKMPSRLEYIDLRFKDKIIYKFTPY